MLPPIRLIRAQLATVLNEKYQQGHVITGLHSELEGLADSYDALLAFARRISDLPMRADWPYREPSDAEGIWAACEGVPWQGVPTVPGDAGERIAAAFVASCCGCMLGKPLEINPTLEDLRGAFERIGEWPLRGYVSEAVGPHLPRAFHGSWVETVRERLAWVAPDDDINYTVLGMLNLQRHGAYFTLLQMKELWLQNLPVLTTFGPERSMLLRAGMASYAGPATEADLRAWVTVANPKEEYCGALIRADAYGYACPGNPALAAELAGRDASFTHRRTGIYATRFVAAAIAAALVAKPEGDRLGVFREALKYVPRETRFYHIAADSLKRVEGARDFLDGYGRIHGQYKEYTHCQVYQEIGTLMNAVRFAADTGDGICLQVMQGNDTDSFGATAGSILGAMFGPGGLEKRWVSPLRDDLRTALALFHERSLAAVARQMAELPGVVVRSLAEGRKDAGEAARGPGAEAGI